ncbi:hypothetical protein [Agreia sp. COWG]|uniref:hypothetical protein n=1 Tax=Agreia sp. COWG TaxID=2773266 RepID=UPI0019291E5F|nr:hypothetical protein [Agreia sp. COWG]
MGFIAGTIPDDVVEASMTEMHTGPAAGCTIIGTLASMSALIMAGQNLVPPKRSDGFYAFEVGTSDGSAEGQDNLAIAQTFGQILIAYLNDDDETAHTIGHVAAATRESSSPLIGFALTFLRTTTREAFPSIVRKA